MNIDIRQNDRLETDLDRCESKFNVIILEVSADSIKIVTF